jgi:hypothetical protein
MRINERRIRSWLTSSFRPARSMASVLGPGRVGIVPHV